MTNSEYSERHWLQCASFVVLIWLCSGSDDAADASLRQASADDSTASQSLSVTPPEVSHIPESPTTASDTSPTASPPPQSS